MKRNTQDLEEIAHLTLEHYNQHAGEFWQGTRDHDVSQNIAALLQCIRNEPPFKILDFGCGPGRDLKTFAELGHIAIGLEGAVHLAIMARAQSAAKCGSRISSSSIYPITISMASSPTPHCFMYRAGSCRAYCWN